MCLLQQHQHAARNLWSLVCRAHVARAAAAAAAAGSGSVLGGQHSRRGRLTLQRRCALPAGRRAGQRAAAGALRAAAQPAVRARAPAAPPLRRRAAARRSAAAASPRAAAGPSAGRQHSRGTLYLHLSAHLSFSLILILTLRHLVIPGTYAPVPLQF